MERSSLRVLIVADAPDVVQLLRGALERHGRIDVSVAASTGEAVHLLDATYPASYPDAVLLDLRLSLLDRHALLRLVRSAPRRWTLPVLMVTGNLPASAIRAAAQAGASGFVPHPFQGAELIYKIEQAVRGEAGRATELTEALRPDADPPGAGPSRAGCR